MSEQTPDPSGLVGDLNGPVRSWKHLLFPSVFLVYLLQTASGVFRHSSGLAAVFGIAILLAFCACYLLSMIAGRSGRSPVVFWRYYAAMLVLTAVELYFAHSDAFVMLVFVSVITVAARYLKGIPVLAAYIVVSAIVPPLVPSWHEKLDMSTPYAIAIVSLAMFAFFGVLRSNEALAEARSEVIRLATENERTRIARDLHDLLGHSLTTITVKAALAHRLTAVDPARAAAEIAEVETLTRKTLSDVRAAVSGYREVTLGNEIAAAREVLRAAGITAQLPGAIDAVVPQDSELFAWVVREGVTNVVRHSRARNCEVRLGERYIEITDDGIGGPSEVDNGLTGLRERVWQAGGRLSAGSPGNRQGWRLRVEIPV
ncbi:MAG: sensor histidine kinase [Actinomycetota bacterium]|nr:sensor histidine kinase [Actinomycetota bacterium]MDQ2958864.1 sensor histidine kinase [Actinomycetota bacterium]